MYFDKILPAKYRNYPTSGRFNCDEWNHIFNKVAVHSHEVGHLYWGGMVIGELINECDSQFHQRISTYSSVNALDYIALINIKTIRYCNELLSQPLKQLGAFNESLLECLLILLKNNRIKVTEVTNEISFGDFENMLPSLSNRVYLFNLWKKVRDFGYGVDQNTQSIIFQPTDETLEFGRVCAVRRREELTLQIGITNMHKVQNGAPDTFNLPKVKPKIIPVQIIIKNGQRIFKYDKPELKYDSSLFMLVAQIPFYFREIFFKPFGKDNLITLKIVVQYWSIIGQIAGLISKYVSDHDVSKLKDIDNLCSFKESELVEIFELCFNYDSIITQAFLEIYSSNTKKLIDIWLTPFIKVNEYYHFIPVAGTSNFQWIIETIQNDFFEIQFKGEKSKSNKGSLFEESVAQYFNEELFRNEFFPKEFCRVFLANIEYKNYDNEEIDIVFRLGQSYLLVETKAFKLGTSCSDYHNIKERLEESNIQRKRKAFINDYERFKLRFDSCADFVLEQEKVHVCYLVSNSHLVGSTINDAPVIDMHILERYFLKGYLTVIRSNQKESRNAYFYQNCNEAEQKLQNYLENPPQLEIYNEQYRCDFQSNWSYQGRPVFVKEGIINLSIDEKEKFALSLSEELI